MFNRIIIFLGILAAITLPTVLEADSIVPPTSQKVAYMLLINAYSTRSNVSAAEVKNVIKHESNYVSGAIGDHGAAYGIGQYHADEFNHYAALYFKATGEKLDYHSDRDQIVLMTFQWKNYPKSRNDWSTYRKLYGVQ